MQFEKNETSWKWSTSSLYLLLMEVMKTPNTTMMVQFRPKKSGLEIRSLGLNTLGTSKSPASSQSVHVNRKSVSSRHYCLSSLKRWQFECYLHVTSKPYRCGKGGKAGSVHTSQARSSHPGHQGSLRTTRCQGGEVTSLEVSSLGLNVYSCNQCKACYCVG